MTRGTTQHGSKSRNDVSADKQVGVWMIGACGAVSTLTCIGARAVSRSLRAPIGLLTVTPLLDGLSLPALPDLVFGGHEIRATDLPCAAREFRDSAGILDHTLLNVLHDDLRDIQKNIRPGYLLNPSAAVHELAGDRVQRPTSTRACVEGIQGDLKAFQDEHDLETVVVVNLSSTEPPAEMPIEYADLDAMVALMASDTIHRGLAAGVVYAYAALDLGFPFINFTPSPGSTIPALVKLAVKRGVPHMGSDGKTGETLVKTALAPMFAGRALRVLSWEGYNMLGNRDGFVLNDPHARESKTRSKDRALRSILGEQSPHAKVTIDYVPSLDDWKVAWDFIHFEGFLGAKMSMQFTWQGNDSALAAPLVLDLVRLAAFAKSEGEAGLMPWTAAYFKNPSGVDEQNFVRQLSLLEAYVARHRAKNQHAKSKRAGDHTGPSHGPR